MRLDFDDGGLVVGMTIIGDDGVMATMQGGSQALAGRTTLDLQSVWSSAWLVLAVTCAATIGFAAGVWLGVRRGRTVVEPTLLG